MRLTRVTLSNSQLNDLYLKMRRIRTIEPFEIKLIRPIVSIRLRMFLYRFVDHTIDAWTIYSYILAIHVFSSHTQKQACLLKMY